MAEKQSTGGLAQVEDQYVSAILITHDGATWLSEVVAALSLDLLQAASSAAPMPIPPMRNAERRVTIDEGK